VLFNLALLSSAMEGGRLEVAEKASLNAQRVMWSEAGKGRGSASLASAEAIKIFKGEPFEKAMASIYSGILYYNWGEFDSARAAFSKALLAIKQKEENREDFALAYLLQAKTFLKLKEEDNARIALDLAKRIYPNHPMLDLGTLASSNALVVIELGKAPKKTRVGPGASLIDWVRQPYPELQALLSIDDSPFDEADEIGDLTYQAKTKGWTGKDTIQATKGATRDAAVVTTIIAADQAARGNKTAGWVALGAGVFALANQSQADTRQWELLPDRFLARAFSLPVGRHTLRIRFLDRYRHALSDYGQVWYYSRNSDSEDQILLLRSKPCQRTGEWKSRQLNGGRDDEFD